MKRHLGTIIKTALAVGLLGYLFGSGKIHLDTLAAALGAWPWLVATLALILLEILLVAWRWWFLLAAVRVPVTLWRALELTLVGMFFSLIVPGSVGGDLAKAYYIARDEPQRQHMVVLSVVIDRYIGLIAIVMVAALAFTWNIRVAWEQPNLRDLGLTTYGVLALGILSWPIIFFLGGRLKGRERPFPLQATIARLHEALEVFRGQPGAVAVALLVSLLNHGLNILGCFALLKALGAGALPLLDLTFVLPLAFLLNAIPVAPGSWGWGEVAFQKLFAYTLAGAFADAGDIGLHLALLLHLCFFVFNMIGAVFYVRVGRVNAKH